MLILFLNFSGVFLFSFSKTLRFSLSALDYFYFLYSEKYFAKTEGAEPQEPPKMELWSRRASSDLVKVIFQGGMGLSVSDTLCGWYGDEPCVHLEKLISQAQWTRWHHSEVREPIQIVVSPASSNAMTGKYLKWKHEKDIGNRSCFSKLIQNWILIYWCECNVTSSHGLSLKSINQGSVSGLCHLQNMQQVPRSVNSTWLQIYCGKRGRCISTK